MMKTAGWLAAGWMLGVGVSAGAQAGGKRAMTFADLMAMKRVSDPQVSPSGKWVMFSVTDVSLETNTKVNHLWVVGLGGKTEADSSAPLRNDKQGGRGGSDGVKTEADSSASLRNDKQGGRGGSYGVKTEADSSAALRNDNRGDGDKRRVERQVTFGDGETNGRFSPDGRFVSLTMKDQVYEIAWDEAKGAVGAAKQVTSVSGGADGAVWAPDSKRLMFVAQVYPECSVKGGAGSSVAGSGAGPTHHDEAVMNGARSGGTGDLEDRSLAGMEAASWAEEDACDTAKDEAAEKDPVKAQIWTSLLYRHWNAFTGVKRTHVLVTNADGGGTRDLTPASAVGDAETPTFSLGGPLGYAWAPDSKEIAYVTNLDAVPAASTNNDVFTLRLDEVGAKAVKVSTSLGSDDGPQYSPDGRWLAFRSQARAGYESDRFRLMVMDREKKTISDAIPNFPGWIDEYLWAGSNPAFHFTSAYQGEERVYVVEMGGKPILERKGGEYGSLSVIPIGGGPMTMLLATKMTVTRPTEVVKILLSDSGRSGIDEHGKVVQDAFGVTSETNSTETDVTSLGSVLDAQLALAPLQAFWFEGAAGAQVEGFVVRPPGFDPKKKYPVKFLIHGGPQGAWGDAWSYRWNPELMAASGYVVVMVNPRGSTGYGQAFIDGVNGDWGGKAYEDLMKGLDAAERQFPFIDKDRECALGGSYGGFMANWILTHNDRFKCIVTHDGMYNPRSAYGTTEELWFNEWEFRRPEDLKPGGKPAQPWRYEGVGMDEDPFRKWSPMLFIQDAKTPTLVIHSQKDYRLDVSEGFQLFTALQRLGVPSEMLYFPDEGHWVLKPKNAELWNKTVGDWCDKWTHTNAYAK